MYVYVSPRPFYLLVGVRQISSFPSFADADPRLSWAKKARTDPAPILSSRGRDVQFTAFEMFHNHIHGPINRPEIVVHNLQRIAA